ncbi:hypothetical protein L4K91_004491 [Salmonella enterica]|nr:hypothetical protein [Salmonella enterica]EBL1889429.1 hypothetical protein [Salmonella enterica]EEN1007476.1 hypothetical protein [Salmonella enterica]EFR7989710.1 hypothetical protein [Salmonella enterica]EGH6051908.1 hypothetical protein [Salmonella enterica]
MAFWDNQDLNFGGDSYNPTQSNVLGQSLAPINPQGELAASDPQFDTRDPLQIKQDAQTANRIATNSADEDENYIKSANGNKYEKVDDSDWHNGLTAAAEYMTSYFASGGNVGVAAKAAGSALYANEAKAHRLGQVDDLENAGMNPLDIQAWINSGNKQDLTRNKGQWQSGGNGVMFNNLTGETRQIPGATNNNIPVKSVDLGDRKINYYADGRQEEVAKGAAPKIQVAGANGGSIGLDDMESQPETQTDENGNTYYWQPFQKGGGKWTPISATQQKALNEKQNASQPTANQQLITTDLQTVNSATPEQLDRFTGQFVGRSTTARDLSSSLDPETRKVYQASERLGGQLGNAAIAGAKAAGASGINTEAEIKRFTASVPQVDYTSQDNYKASIAKIQQYAENFKNELIRSKGATPAPTQQAAPQGVTHVERGPDGKLRIVQG